METIEVFKYLQEQIHTTIIATNDENGLPVTCAIDIMDYDENGLYFLTATGKNFYKRLKATGYLSLTGIKGDNTMSCVAVSFTETLKNLARNSYKDCLIKTRICTKYILPNNHARHLRYFAYMQVAENYSTFLKNLSSVFRSLSVETV